MAAASFDQIGQQFVQTYYNTFDTNRPALSALYVCFFPLPSPSLRIFSPFISVPAHHSNPRAC